MESYTESERHNQKAAMKRIIDVFKFIESAYQTEITLKKAAEVSGFSVYHFSRLFKEVAELNFVDYLNQFRINKSLYLLRHTEEKIAQIATKTGFKSIQTFNRVFKEVMNCIPSEYRSKK
jgi:AraC-like DNA-binding protein